MSHHGREYEEDRVEYIRDTPEQSLELALKTLGAKDIKISVRTHVTVTMPNGVVLGAVGNNRLEALTAMVQEVAALKVPRPRK